MSAGTKGGVVEQPPLFEAWAVEESAAVDRVVAAYQRKQITHAEMVKRVRAIVDRYDVLSRTIVLEEIEEVLGEEIPEFWSASKKTRGDEAYEQEEDDPWE